MFTHLTTIGTDLDSCFKNGVDSFGSRLSLMLAIEATMVLAANFPHFARNKKQPESCRSADYRGTSTKKIVTNK